LYGVFPYYMSLENDGNANGVFLLNSNAMGRYFIGRITMTIIIIIQSNPTISKFQGSKFKIAGFQNKRGSVKFVTVNHLLIKYRTFIKKDTD